MGIEIVDSSPLAVELAKTVVATPKATRYPFKDLQVGKSFTVPIAEANVASLQSLCSQRSKDGKVFKFIRHDDMGVIEVARVA